MQMISLIVGSLALLAAGVALILTVRENKRGIERGAAALRYADAAAKDAAAALVSQLHESIHNMENQNGRILERVQALEGGMVPDYERAKAAANAVNDFNQGLTNILNFEPMDALRKGRSQEGK